VYPSAFSRHNQYALPAFLFQQQNAGIPSNIHTNKDDRPGVAQ
jgi:hypothetical protein